jgi:hypothetical protein
LDVWRKWFALITSAGLVPSLGLTNGVGKSTLLAHFVGSLESKAYLPLLITQATLSAAGLLAVLLSKLGQKSSQFRSRNLARLEESLKELGRVIPVLVLEAS